MGGWEDDAAEGKVFGGERAGFVKQAGVHAPGQGYSVGGWMGGWVVCLSTHDFFSSITHPPTHPPTHLPKRLRTEHLRRPRRQRSNREGDCITQHIKQPKGNSPSD